LTQTLVDSLTKSRVAAANAIDIRLVLADVDGTLLTREKVLTKETLTVIGELHDAGIAFAITSGRPPRGMRMFIKPLALQGAIAGFDGGVFFTPDMSVIRSYPLDLATAKLIVQHILSQGLDAWVYTQKEWLIRDAKAPRVAHEASNVKFNPTVVPAFTDDHLADAVKIVGVSDDFSLVAACESSLQLCMGTRASAARSQPFYVDVTHPNANKGAVATTLAEMMHISLSQIATIGDMPNDVLMFRKSGFSIAMGNASDDVKAQASAVTQSNEDEGFAKGMRKFLLSPRQQ
jgi:Cof subfamily protein (haloacid dehalogenase superfamily)